MPSRRRAPSSRPANMTIAWNMQVEDEVLLRLEKGGKGKTIYAVGGDIEFIALNFTDPNTEVDGERSSMKTKHPLFSDPAVRKALALLVDRDADPESHLRPRRAHHRQLPQRARRSSSPRTPRGNSASKRRPSCWTRPDGRPGADGIREKDGKKLKLLYQTSINGPRQKTQAIVKQACQKAGIDVELKSVVASVFFSSDVANPDTYAKFYADIEMFQIPMTQPDPAQHMRRYHSRFVATKENKWQGTNFPRWVNKDYDAAIDAAENETDPVKRAALYIKCNDLHVAGHGVHPRDAPPQGGRHRQHAAPGDQRLGQRHRQSAGLVPGGVRTSRRRDCSLMSQYVLRRLLIAVPSLLGISLVLFIVLALAPGDPVLGTGDQSERAARSARSRFGPSSASTIRSIFATCTGSSRWRRATGAFPSSAG